MSILLIFVAFLLQASSLRCETIGTCKWGYNDYILDLHELQNIQLIKNDSQSTYIYTPCQNTDINNNTYMLIKEELVSTEYEILAVWDDGELSPTFNANTNEWQFAYYNVLCLNMNVTKVQMFIFFVCDANVDYLVTFVNKSDICEYTMYINSTYACANVPTSPSTLYSQLSGGWIFIIVCFILFSIYCMVGWVGNAINKQSINVVDNIPHKTFWCSLPHLVMAGCCISRDFLTICCLIGNDYFCNGKCFCCSVNHQEYNDTLDEEEYDDIPVIIN